ncbi:hypothetical protein BT63DRAFT_450673 [Microthyrium microscopicum]|uniref:C2H2-type domain-containing protein n=1 Tax=Microthyrium microscopicum TaxID=703497 RepID=A0A6A6UMB9_9PEZI|nr:hypothetical protein BT63DRAFT_450673 [Microthyrium microscopicum]
MWPNQTTQTPAIRISASTTTSHQHHGLGPDSLSPPSRNKLSSALPMPIPSPRDDIPPPLPPPRYIDALNKGRDPGWQWANGVIQPDATPEYETDTRYHTLPLRPEISRTRSENPRDSHLRHYPSQSLPNPLGGRLNLLERLEGKDEEGAVRPNLARLQSENQLSLRTLHSSAQQFDRQQLSKLDGPSRPTSSSLPNSLPSPRDLSHARRTGNTLKPLRVPDYRHGGPDSPLMRWPGSSPSALSSTTASGVRSPLFESSSIDYTRSPPYNRLVPSDGGEDRHSPYIHRNSVEHSSVFSEPDMPAEESGMKNLHLHDRTPIAEEGSSFNRKRRAPSPTLESSRDSRSSGNHNDLYHKRSMQVLNSNRSPSARLPPIGSTSTASSLAQSAASHWNNSIASSATSYNSERISPSALSPSAESEYPRLPPLSAGGDQSASDNRANSQWRSDKWEIERQNTLLLSMNAAGLYACECCLKKPRRFRTLDELRQHESEKQYQCQYCSNRFKNKNEAERHQNSLHLRKYSWSCAALSNPRQAFHQNPARAEISDVCGYCGKEFQNPSDWHARNEHLVTEHKFGECNQHKKFFRADHFRQHLKHSHGAASGKWTGQLEAICIKDEPLPALRGPPQLVGQSNNVLPPISMVGEDPAPPVLR